MILCWGAVTYHRLDATIQYNKIVDSPYVTSESETWDDDD